MWTGNEIVGYGKWVGKKWNQLPINSIQYYAKEFSSGPLQLCAEAELTRRNRALEKGLITNLEWSQGL